MTRRFRRGWLIPPPKPRPSVWQRIDRLAPWVFTAILLAGWQMTLPCFLCRSEEAKVGAATTQIAVFKTALDTYILDDGSPPPTAQGLLALLERPRTASGRKRWKGPYLNNVSLIPDDPWGNPYLYASPGPGGKWYLIVSLGKDGRPGGTGLAADISSVDASPARVSATMNGCECGASAGATPPAPRRSPSAGLDAISRPARRGAPGAPPSR